jgi:TFIIF-interacting CTD phosphatase-like protein
MFPSAIQINYKDTNGGIIQITFASFKNRNSTYELLKKYCSQSNPECENDAQEEEQIEQQNGNAKEEIIRKFEANLPKHEDNYKTCTFSMTAQEFFNRFYSDDAKLSLSEIYTMLGNPLYRVKKCEDESVGDYFRERENENNDNGLQDQRSSFYELRLYYSQVN